MEKFILNKDRVLAGKLCASKGDLVYECVRFDYGASLEDSILLREPHISVTVDPEGGYPFFTIPLNDLDKVTIQ